MSRNPSALSRKNPPSEEVSLPWMMASMAGLGMVGLGAWLGEVVLVKGWQDLAWMRGYPMAALVGVPCVIGAVSLPLTRGNRQPAPRKILFFVLGSVVAWLSFEVARRALYRLNVNSAALLGPIGEVRSHAYRNVGYLAGAVLLTVLGLPLVARLLLDRIPWRMGGWFLLALLLVVLLSRATLQVFPAPHDPTDVLHAVKMGYPLFWTTLLMGLASWIGRSLHVEIAADREVSVGARRDPGA